MGKDQNCECNKRTPNLVCSDGNSTAIRAAYPLSDLAFIFPITPASPMSALVDVWSGQQKKNIFGEIVDVRQMQSEGGVAGALHGANQGGSLVSTYTSCQGLLLMIPNMYKMAGEHAPIVFHVATRTLANIAMNIYPDHSDVMAARDTGFAMFNSCSVQEVMDFAAISHFTAIDARIPIMHFFDGLRTSHEVSKFDALREEELVDMYPFERLTDWRRTATMNPADPKTRAGVYNGDLHWQVLETGRKGINNVPNVIQKYMDRIGDLTGRRYKVFEYVGAPDATHVIAQMGSGVPVTEEVVNYLVAKGEKVGLIKVRVFRPFSIELLLAAVPKTVTHITALDRSKEMGMNGGPLFQEIAGAILQNLKPIQVISGYHGINGKDYTPTMCLAVYDNMKEEKPMRFFNVGIDDDLLGLSLKVSDVSIDTVPEGTVQCKFYALGSDGTVGANKNAISIIGENTDMYAQGYFQYDSKKSGGFTVSHLRFGKSIITSQYNIEHADYVACHTQGYVHKYDMLSTLKQGGTFVMNTHWTTQELLEKHLPGNFMRKLAEKEAKFYVVDASKLADEVGLSGRINMIMQSVFFKLSAVLPIEEALELLKTAVQKSYGGKGAEVVEMNIKAIDQACAQITPIDIPASWKESKLETLTLAGSEKHYMKNVAWPSLMQEGNNVKPSSLTPYMGGWIPTGTAKYEKRAVVDATPVWEPEKCIQCNRCATMCSHAVIRPFILDEEEMKNAPEGFKTKPITGRQKKLMGGKGHYSIQISRDDCVKCGACITACPKDCLHFVSVEDPKQKNAMDYWNYANNEVARKPDMIDGSNFRDLQFVQPLLEFSAACGGCSETVYVRMLTQMFGEEMLIADSCGCSLVWGSSYPSIPYTVSDLHKRGPAQGGTLFEDTAEYGLGMATAAAARRGTLIMEVKKLLERVDKIEGLTDGLRAKFAEWLPVCLDKVKAKRLADEIRALLPKEAPADPLFRNVYDGRDLLAKKVVWIVGGDGWAYDIGFGGLDHVLSMGCDLNILVIDTEVYSNTGGQKSKATPRGAVAGFAALGQRTGKKDLAMLAMQYKSVYVATCSVGANPMQTVKCLMEAEDYEGTSLVIGYCPCIAHGIRSGMNDAAIDSKLAVETGYWPMFRFDPRKDQPLTMDSKKPSKPLKELLDRETRFKSLADNHAELAEELQKSLQKDIESRLMKLDLFLAGLKEKAAAAKK